MKVLSYLILTCSIILVACNPTSDELSDWESSVIKKYPISFESNNNLFENKQLRFKSLLFANETGDSLFLAFNVTNKTKDSLIINNSEIQIATSTTRANAVELSEALSIIEPGKNRTFEYCFLPVNNKLLFFKIGERGALNSNYLLSTSFIKNAKMEAISGKDNEVSFVLNQQHDVVFAKQRDTDKKAHFFKISNADKLKLGIQENVKEIEQQANENDREVDEENHQNYHEVSVQLTETEVLAGGIVTKLNFYNQDTILKLWVRVVNHGKSVVQINPDKFIVEVGKKDIVPTNIQILSNDTLDNNKRVTIRKSQRFSFKANYKAQEIEEFNLRIKNYIYTLSKKEVFPDPILFTRDFIEL